MIATIVILYALRNQNEEGQWDIANN
jgi:hypothetical protein